MPRDPSRKTQEQVGTSSLAKVQQLTVACPRQQGLVVTASRNPEPNIQPASFGCNGRSRMILPMVTTKLGQERSAFTRVNIMVPGFAVLLRVPSRPVQRLPRITRQMFGDSSVPDVFTNCSHPTRAYLHGLGRSLCPPVIQRPCFTAILTANIE